jgi:hypothetical protein
MFDLMERCAARLMNGVRVNQIQRCIRNGVPVYAKRRKVCGSFIIWFGNCFLTLARSGICMFVRAGDWMKWEAHCSSLLYPDRPPVELGPGKVVSVAEIIGTSLRSLVLHNASALKPIIATARELHRVHQIHCQYFQSAWSHGDLHLDNILYDEATDRAFLIDFDTRHQFAISPTQRHSDDVYVFLMALIAIPEDHWFDLAIAFIREYSDHSVLQELERQLFVPAGFARILWYTRTQCAPIRQSAWRMEYLRQALSQFIHQDSN